MSNVTFYFIRHGYSCSNLNKKRKTKMTEEKGDSHLTNWGILSSIFTGIYLNDTFFNDIKFDYTYCSPLIRTWETAACMFSDKYKTFTVGPHLSEIRKDDKTSYEYKVNQNRFKEFVRYVTSDSETSSINYLVGNLDKSDIIHKQINNIKKFNVLYSGNKYPESYINVSEGNLEKFIMWFVSKVKSNKKLNVVIICHNTLMIKFLNKYYRYTYYKHNILETNNFSFKVTVKNNKIGHPVLFFLGIKNPIGDENSIDVECSLCNENKNKNNKKCSEKDKNIHTKLLNNREMHLSI